MVEKAEENVLEVLVPFAFGSVAGLDEFCEIAEALEALSVGNAGAVVGAEGADELVDVGKSGR